MNATRTHLLSGTLDMHAQARAHTNTDTHTHTLFLSLSPRVSSCKYIRHAKDVYGLQAKVIVQEEDIQEATVQEEEI